MNISLFSWKKNSKKEEKTLPKTYPPLKPPQPKPHDLVYPFTLKKSNLIMHESILLYTFVDLFPFAAN